MSSTLRVWLKFNMVGLLGMGVQLITLTLLTSGFGVNYLAATAMAVEGAVIHNFIWHECWTWLDRTKGDTNGTPGRLLRFHLANGAISIAGNLGLMWLLVSRVHLHYFVANVMAIGTCAILNFLASDRLVFS
jgi:putative flippase GtrA